MKERLQQLITRYKNAPDYIIGPILLIAFLGSIGGTLYIGSLFFKAL